MFEDVTTQMRGRAAKGVSKIIDSIPGESLVTVKQKTLSELQKEYAAVEMMSVQEFREYLKSRMGVK